MEIENALMRQRVAHIEAEYAQRDDQRLAELEGLRSELERTAVHIHESSLALEARSKALEKREKSLDGMRITIGVEHERRVADLVHKHRVITDRMDLERERLQATLRERELTAQQTMQRLQVLETEYAALQRTISKLHEHEAGRYATLDAVREELRAARDRVEAMEKARDAAAAKAEVLQREKAEAEKACAYYLQKVREVTAHNHQLERQIRDMDQAQVDAQRAALDKAQAEEAERSEGSSGATRPSEMLSQRFLRNMLSDRMASSTGAAMADGSGAEAGPGMRDLLSSPVTALRQMVKEIQQSVNEQPCMRQPRAVVYAAGYEPPSARDTDARNAPRHGRGQQRNDHGQRHYDAGGGTMDGPADGRSRSPSTVAVSNASFEQARQFPLLGVSAAADRGARTAHNHHNHHTSLLEVSVSTMSSTAATPVRQSPVLRSSRTRHERPRQPSHDRHSEERELHHGERRAARRAHRQSPSKPHRQHGSDRYGGAIGHEMSVDSLAGGPPTTDSGVGGPALNASVQLPQGVSPTRHVTAADALGRPVRVSAVTEPRGVPAQLQPRWADPQAAGAHSSQPTAGTSSSTPTASTSLSSPSRSAAARPDFPAVGSAAMPTSPLGSSTMRVSSETVDSPTQYNTYVHPQPSAAPRRTPGDDASHFPDDAWPDAAEASPNQLEATQRQRPRHSPSEALLDPHRSQHSHDAPREEASAPAVDGAVAAFIANLKQSRSSILATGAYTEDDELIRQMTERIAVYGKFLEERRF